ncbi:unnamed protein product [Dicrocoelium dendriticum]|nr:unnamed protein product [Dicrocoelium dendriticum]
MMHVKSEVGSNLMVSSSRIATVLDGLMFPFDETDETESTDDLLTILSHDWSISDVSDHHDALSQRLSFANQFERAENMGARYRKTSLQLPQVKHIDSYSPRYNHACYRIYPQGQRGNLPNRLLRERKDTARILELGATRISNILKKDSKSLASNQRIRHRKIASHATSRESDPRFRTMHSGVSVDLATGSPDFTQDAWKNYTASNDSTYQSNRLTVSTPDPKNCRQLHTESKFTAWERWLIEKEKQRRKFAEEDTLIKIKNQELAEKAKAKLEQQKIMAARKWEEWKEMKQRLTLEQKKSEEEQQRERLFKERLSSEEKVKVVAFTHFIALLLTRLVD